MSDKLSSNETRSFLSIELLDNRYPALHGLRSIAIFSIILIHVNSGLPRSIVFQKSSLWFGMDLFFVMSGFLIGGLLFHSQEKGTVKTFARFYFRRAFRTLPAYYVTLLLLTTFWTFYHSEHPKEFSRGTVLRELFFLTNYPALNKNYVMGWSWSLSLEEHFYLISPFLIGFIKRASHKLKVFIIAFSFVAPIFIRMEAATTWENFFREIYTPTHMRFDTLIMGVLIAYIHNDYGKLLDQFFVERKMAFFAFLTGISLLAVLTIYPMSLDQTGPILNPVYMALAFGTITSAAYGSLILWAIYGKDIIVRFLSTKPFRVIATLGYGVYLIHLFLINGFLKILPHNGIILWMECMTTVIVFSFIYSYLIHILIDKPILKLRSTLTEKPISRIQ